MPASEIWVARLLEDENAAWREWECEERIGRGLGGHARFGRERGQAPGWTHADLDDGAPIAVKPRSDEDEDRLAGVRRERPIRKNEDVPVAGDSDLERAIATLRDQHRAGERRPAAVEAGTVAQDHARVIPHVPCGAGSPQANR